MHPETTRAPRRPLGCAVWAPSAACPSAAGALTAPLPSLRQVAASGEGSAISGYLSRCKKGKRHWKKLWFVIKGKVLYTYAAREVAWSPPLSCPLGAGGWSLASHRPCGPDGAARPASGSRLRCRGAQAFSGGRRADTPPRVCLSSEEPAVA